MHTSIAKLLAVVSDNSAYQMTNNIPGRPDDEAERGTRDVRRILSGVAHYVADPKIVKLAGSDAAMATFDAMTKAGIRNLPFDPILIEFAAQNSGTTKTVHSFVRLQTKPIVPGRFWDSAGVDHSDEVDIYAYVVQYQNDSVDRENIYVASLPCEVPIAVTFAEDGRAFVVKIAADVMDAGESDTNPLMKMEYTMHLVVAEAMSIAMLMLNTKGIEHVPVSMAKLNKARAKNAGRNHFPISDYTVLRVGHVYDANGEAHSLAGSGRHMPVHWRAGHVRNVPYGPHGAAVRPTRLRYIPPCLVNFDPLLDPQAPTPKREVTV
jgi:hypothetical protein